MSFINAEMLLEFVIRVGVDDVQSDPEIASEMFSVDFLTNTGMNLTPPGVTDEIFETTLMDSFQKRLKEIPLRSGETGRMGSIFSNSIPSVPSISDYLSQANVSIRHGYPRDGQDLPMICITLGNEDERQYLGLLKYTAQSKDKKKTYLALGCDAESQYMINIFSTNFNETVIWYHLIKRAFIVYRAILEAYGLREVSVSWTDPEPAPEYIQGGMFVYQRSCIVRGVKDEYALCSGDGEFSSLAFEVNSQGEREVLPGADENDAGEGLP